MFSRFGRALAARVRRRSVGAGRGVHRAQCRVEDLEVRSLPSGPPLVVSGAGSLSIPAEIGPIVTRTEAVSGSWLVAEVPVQPLTGPVSPYIETEAPVQRLPIAAAIEVTGRLEPDERADLYRVPVTPATQGMQFVMRMDAPADASPMQVEFMDESGHVLGRFSVSPETDGVAVNMQRTGQASALYLEISGGSQFQYNVLIQRMFGAVAPEPDGPELPSSPVPTKTPSGMDQPPAGATAPVLALSRADEALPRTHGPVPITTGPGLSANGDLPLVTAAPSGGVLSPADLTPTVDRYDPAQFDLALGTVANQAVEAGSVPNPDPDGPDILEGIDPDLAPFHAPGGDVFLLPRPRPIFRAAPDPTIDVPVSSLAASASAALPPPDLSPTDRPRTAWRLSVRGGMAVAALLGIGLLLPDLGACPALWSRRPRRKKSAEC